ncbi:MAG: DUF1697 domain-containing protein [Caldilineaceae bacterium]|nr:DUF1697 domain-containing protein [Caldilineaceae bacterium]
MNTYVILMRGINVGGKNKIAMAELKLCLVEQGFEDVVTYIQSGNAVLRSGLDAETVSATIENILPQRFKLDSSLIRVLALEHQTYKEIVAGAPEEFGKDHTNYRYDVLFLMGVSPSEAMKQIEARQGIDDVWQGDKAVYFRRPSLAHPNAAKSGLARITQKPIYQAITIRNWNTTTKLLEILEGDKT